MLRYVLSSVQLILLYRQSMSHYKKNIEMVQGMDHLLFIIEDEPSVKLRIFMVTFSQEPIE